jgi:CSLREA domain-containing protein
MSQLDSLKIICLTLVLALALTIAPAQAATIIVNNTGDTDGDDLACTLREAIVSIHSLTTVSTGCTHTGLFGISDAIEFNPGLVNQTITLNQGANLSPLNIRKNLTISGLGKDKLTIDQAGAISRAFYIENATVSLNDLTITGGYTEGNGGGFKVVDSNFTLSNCAVLSNSAEHNGGGIHALRSNITLSNSTVSSNRVSGIAGVSISGSGGGIYAIESIVKLTNSSVSGNSAGENGGGIALVTSSKLSLFKSTISSNTA